MHKPKTYLSDYEAFNGEENTLRSWLTNGRINQLQFDQMRANLQEEYRNKISPEDLHLFDDIGSLLGFLIDNGLPVTQIGHEILHGTAATKLGYTVKYGCQLLLTEENQTGYIPLVKVLENITAEDYKKIVTSPNELSKGDNDALNALK
ncbi:hypothetical protein JXB28_05035 [Candidatus Woesearchaeota archaeon]|nr:hypothetical protein [Candidatus Woesearchaeota archaeon]